MATRNGIIAGKTLSIARLFDRPKPNPLAASNVLILAEKTKTSGKTARPGKQNNNERDQKPS
jgi:hypothetical protein